MRQQTKQHSREINITTLVLFLREALFTSESVKLGHVRPCVSPLVRIIIDFCEGDMKGAETLLDTGSLNYGFWWF